MGDYPATTLSVMQTIEVTIPVSEDLHEFLIAELNDLDFEAFEQEDEVLKAYVPASRWNDISREWIEQWLISQGIEPALKEVVYEPTNWNARWEETVRPVVVPPFIIKPTWAQLPSEHQDKILLEVDPKMSFGTGYHESTRLMLRLMAGIDFTETLVLDAGTGTGVLAIAAAKCGAQQVIAFDVDRWSFENGGENVILNGVQDRVDVRFGGIEAVQEGEAVDVILANINLNVLLGLLPEFHRRLGAEGRLVMSGMMLQDRLRMASALQENGFSIEREYEEGDWWAVTARRDHVVAKAA